MGTGMGLASRAGELAGRTGKPVVAVATHGHAGHVGGQHGVADVRARRLAAGLLRCAPVRSLRPRQAWGAVDVAALDRAGYDLGEPLFVTARPAGIAAGPFRQQPRAQVRGLGAGDVIDLGDRAFDVRHLPGHSPGPTGRWDPGTGTVFSGDASYDGPLLDELAGADIGQYGATMERLIVLPVTVVHAGHDPRFGRDRRRQLATADLHRRR